MPRISGLSPKGETLPSGQDSPQRGEVSVRRTDGEGEEEMSPQGDREGGGHFLALRAHSVDKRQPLQVLGKVARGVVGRPAHRPPSTYGRAPIDAAGCGHPALRKDKGCGVRVDVGIDPYDII